MLPPDRCGGDKTMGPGNVGPSVLMKEAFILAVNGFCVEWNCACPRPNPSRAGEAKLDPWGDILQHRGWWQVVADRPHGGHNGALFPASPGLSPASQDLRGSATASGRLLWADWGWEGSSEEEDSAQPPAP